MFDKVVIIGVGQIGASIGMNLIQRRLAREVIGVGRSSANLREAVRRRAIHRGVRVNPAGVRLIAPLQNLGENDLILLATPVRGIIDYLKKIPPPPHPLPRGEGERGRVIPRGPLVVDVGSTKGSIIATAEKRRLRFVGCHPIAGTEKGGAAAGRIDLFRGRKCILTPAPHSSEEDRRKVERLWKRLGAEVSWMEAKRHDRLLATVSHLPHAVAYALVETVRGLGLLPAAVKFSLGGFKDTTRIAASPPEMWRDIFLENRTFVLRALRRYQKELQRLTSHLVKGDHRRLLRYLGEARKARLRFAP